jgi:hypothetical protein
MTAADLRKALVGTACPECGAKYEPMESDFYLISMVHLPGCSAPVCLSAEGRDGDLGAAPRFVPFDGLIEYGTGLED